MTSLAEACGEPCGDCGMRDLPVDGAARCPYCRELHFMRSARSDSGPRFVPHFVLNRPEGVIPPDTGMTDEPDWDTP